MTLIEGDRVEADKRNAWLMLIHQLPSKPAYLRVKIWRRLQGLGAILFKNSVYVLPAGEQSLEDLQWVLREIEQAGGQGAICEASLMDGFSDAKVRGLFNAARDADYDEIANELRDLSSAVSANGAASKPEILGQLQRLKRRLAEVVRIDFFGATGRLTVEGLVSEIDKRLAVVEAAHAPATHADPAGIETLIGKTWVTRQGIHVDRIACAWLIRRFVDPGAQFKFVSGGRYEPKPGELRFDMFEAEFTHVGDKCTFEVLLEAISLADNALTSIAEVVHDIDLKDNKFGHEETAGIAHVIAGLCASQKLDAVRIERGSVLFDDTYAYFRAKPVRSK